MFMIAPCGGLLNCGYPQIIQPMVLGSPTSRNSYVSTANWKLYDYSAVAEFRETSQRDSLNL